MAAEENHQHSSPDNLWEETWGEDARMNRKPRLEKGSFFPFKRHRPKYSLKHPIILIKVTLWFETSAGSWDLTEPDILSLWQLCYAWHAFVHMCALGEREGRAECILVQWDASPNSCWVQNTSNVSVPLFVTVLMATQSKTLFTSLKSPCYTSKRISTEILPFYPKGATTSLYLS